MYFDKYESISFRSKSSLRENVKNYLIYSETFEPSLSVYHLPLAAIFILDFSTFASWVANAPRKLRYHQLCSPASLPTEWTQSGSLSSESSFRWSLSLIRVLPYRPDNGVIIVTPHHVSLSRIFALIILKWNIALFKCATWCLIDLIDRAQYSSILYTWLNLGINSTIRRLDQKNGNSKTTYYFNTDNSIRTYSSLYLLPYI